MKRVAVIAVVLAGCSSAWAGSPFYGLTEAQKRKVVVPDIKALTYCVARITAEDPEGLDHYRNGGFSDYVARQLGKCPREMNALLELYESTYGDGEAERFIKGPYLSDLPRAVLSVVRPKLDAKVATLRAEEQRIREEEEVQAAEAQRKVEQERLETARLESERAAVEDKAKRDKQERVDVSMGAMGVIRDRFYTCVDQQFPGLVKSGESAQVLAQAATTICGKQLADVEDAAIEVAKTRQDDVDGGAGLVLREQVKALVKERVVADAVQAKAGVGMFASSAK